MTLKQIEMIKKLKMGETVEIGQVTIKRDRGQYNVSKDKFIKIYKDTDFHVMSEKIDELNTEKISNEKLSFTIPGTKIIAIKTLAGYELWEDGKLLQKGLTEDDVDSFLSHYKVQQDNKKVERVRKEIINEKKMSNQKKVLYYFILLLSAALLITTYVLGLKFDGVSINRNNNTIYQIITEVAEVKYPEKKSDKFDAVYYTLLYHVHQQDYFMTETLINEVPITVISELRDTYLENELSLDLSRDATYSGYEFNLYFKSDLNKYVNREEAIRRVGYILGHENITTIEELISAYLVWDANDAKSNRAYNWDLTNYDGTKTFDYNASYYTTYLSRNGFVKLFLNDSSKFIHEYYLFESVGWLTWTSIVIFGLYLVLAFSIWIFKKDHLKMSKPLLIIIASLAAVLIVPLLMQYFFEGLRKDATEFLDILENTRFTTVTTIMNMIFDYIMKFSNIVLTGIFTIALPLQVVRYFVFNAISKLDKGGKLLRTIAPGTVLSQDINKLDWRI